MIRKIGVGEIGVIVVMFTPKEADIENVINIAESYEGVIVDNSSKRNFDTDCVGMMKYIYLGENTGIANAQNVGLIYLNRFGKINYFLFLDQDSRIDNNYPLLMVSEYVKIKRRVPKLALLGPTVVEIDTQQEYRSMFHSFSTSCDGFEQRRDVISSGSIVEKCVIEDVGLMLLTLFIDFVDYEWCWRAEASGYVVGITKNVRISHKVGESDISIGHYKVQIWSPIRYFYQFRNHLLLCTLSYVPLQWKIVTSIKHFIRLLYFPLFVSRGGKSWKNMWRGIFAFTKHRKKFMEEIVQYRNTRKCYENGYM